MGAHKRSRSLWSSPPTEVVGIMLLVEGAGYNNAKKKPPLKSGGGGAPPPQKRPPPPGGGGGGGPLSAPILPGGGAQVLLQKFLGKKCGPFPQIFLGPPQMAPKSFFAPQNFSFFFRKSFSLGGPMGSSPVSKVPQVLVALLQI